MKTVELDTRDMPASDRLDRWRQSLLEGFGPIHVQAMRDMEPQGELRSCRRGPLAFHTMTYAGMQLWRKPADVAHLTEEVITLTMPATDLHVELQGQACVLRSGHIYLFNHAVTYKTHSAQPYHTRSVAFAASLLRERVGSLLPLHDLTACSAHPASTGLLRTFADHLATGVADWTEHEFTTLSNQFLDMLGLFVQGASTADPASASFTRVGHRERAMQYIRQHADQPGLSPQQVADACGISLGYLHEVFRSSDLSVEEQIFEQRLALARRLLLDPAWHNRPIRSICYEAGFSDPGHFSRRFKARFGLTPGEVRQSVRHATAAAAR